MIQSNEQWFSYYDEHEMNIPMDIIEFCDENHNLDDDLFFVYAAKLYYERQHGNV